MIKSLDTDAVLHYSLSLISRVIFYWLSRHSCSLFSVLVSLCSKIKTVCDKKWLNEYENLSPTPKNVVKKSNIIKFKRKLIPLHVARNLCLVSVQQKTHMRPFMTFFPSQKFMKTPACTKYLHRYPNLMHPKHSSAFRQFLTIF